MEVIFVLGTLFVFQIRPPCFPFLIQMYNIEYPSIFDNYFFLIFLIFFIFAL